jgi:hypothetical protein
MQLTLLKHQFCLADSAYEAYHADVVLHRAREAIPATKPFIGPGIRYAPRLVLFP